MTKPKRTVVAPSRRRFVQWAALAAAPLMAASGTGLAQGTGRFTVRDHGKIHDPLGRQFRVRGTNLFPNQNEASFAKALGAGGWGFNALRLNWLPGKFTYAQLDKAIDTYTALGMVTIVDWHKVGGYGEAPAERKAVLGHFDRLAKAYKDNPYVWYGGYNEPGGLSDCILMRGEWMWDSERVDKWVDLSRAVVERVRNAGALAPVFVPSMVLAQDILVDGKWNRQFQRPLAERSAILTHGHRVRERFDNIAFDLHLYGNYNSEDGLGDLDAFLNEAEGRGMSIVFGEYGSEVRGNSTIRASRNLAALRGKRHFGEIVWHGSATDKNDLTIAPGTAAGIREIDNFSKPTNLTELGRIVWEGTHEGGLSGQ